LAARENSFIRWTYGQVLADAQKGFEVDALASESRKGTVSASVCALGDEDRLGEQKSVFFHECSHIFVKPCSAIHGFNGKMSRGEFAFTSKVEVAVAVFEYEGKSFLVIDTPRGSHLEDGDLCLGCTRTRDRMGLDFVHDRAFDVA
jgi:hypothetical protein